MCVMKPDLVMYMNCFFPGACEASGTLLAAIVRSAPRFPNLPHDSIFSLVPALLGGVPDSARVHVYTTEPNQ